MIITSTLRQSNEDASLVNQCLDTLTEMQADREWGKSEGSWPELYCHSEDTEDTDVFGMLGAVCDLWRTGRITAEQADDLSAFGISVHHGGPGIGCQLSWDAGVADSRMLMARGDSPWTPWLHLAVDQLGWLSTEKQGELQSLLKAPMVMEMEYWIAGWTDRQGNDHDLRARISLDVLVQYATPLKSFHVEAQARHRPSNRELTDVVFALISEGELDIPLDEVDYVTVDLTGGGDLANVYISPWRAVVSAARNNADITRSLRQA